MTDKKKPEEDEVTDEQLDDVSGGGSGGLNTYSTPTSDGAVPIPYPSVPTTSTPGTDGLSTSSGDESGGGADTTSGTGTAGGTIDFVGKAITPVTPP